MSPALQEDSLPAEPSEIIIPIHLHKIVFCLFTSEYLFLVMMQIFSFGEDTM